MEQFIGCDAHKKFSVFVAVNEKGQAGEALRVAHDRKLYRELLARLPAHSAIAVEASGSYSWLVDEMERSGHRPKLCNPHEAKRRMGLTNKTDKLDAIAVYPKNQDLAGFMTSEQGIGLWLRPDWSQIVIQPVQRFLDHFVPVHEVNVPTGIDDVTLIFLRRS
jgi:hypothetical protein